MPQLLVALLFAYGLGCLSAGYYLALWKGLDLRTAGSGSTGARNAGRLLGKGAFVFTFGLDVFKGLAAVMVARLLVPSPWAPPLAWMLVVLGHVWPVQLGFKGGRGISPAVGGLLATSPLLAALLAIPLLLGWGLTRSFKQGGMLAVLVGPLPGLVPAASPRPELLGLPGLHAARGTAGSDPCKDAETREFTPAGRAVDWCHLPENPGAQWKHIDSRPRPKPGNSRLLKN